MKGAYPWRICTFGFTHGCIMKTSCLCLNFVLRMMLVFVNSLPVLRCRPCSIFNATLRTSTLAAFVTPHFLIGNVELDGRIWLGSRSDKSCNPAAQASREPIYVTSSDLTFGAVTCYPNFISQTQLPHVEI
jgi:hypothetical protein